MHISDLDYVLEFLNNNRDRVQSTAIISKKLKDFRPHHSDSEIEIIMSHLLKDGFVLPYAHREFGKKNIHGEDHYYFEYRISFEGMLFVEQKGYTQQALRKQTEIDNKTADRTLENELKSNQKLVNILSVVLTFLSSIFIGWSIILQSRDKTAEEIKELRITIQELGNANKQSGAYAPNPIDSNSLRKVDTTLPQ
ncbi:MAG TPA: hypothetical protein VK625_01840 [Flavitalea sp.]|nr:hypothetical protein [Flavitalea sp.]